MLKLAAANRQAWPESNSWNPWWKLEKIFENIISVLCSLPGSRCDLPSQGFLSLRRPRRDRESEDLSAPPQAPAPSWLSLNCWGRMRLLCFLFFFYKYFYYYYPNLNVLLAFSIFSRYVGSSSFILRRNIKLTIEHDITHTLIYFSLR